MIIVYHKTKNYHQIKTSIGLYIYYHIKIKKNYDQAKGWFPCSKCSLVLRLTQIIKGVGILLKISVKKKGCV